MREAPQVSRNGQWLKMMSGPPSNFITGPVKLPVVVSAHGHGDLIADLRAKAASTASASSVESLFLSGRARCAQTATAS